MPTDCIFCKIIKGDIPSYSIFENDDFKVILDRFPSSLGHALIITKKHYNNIFELDADTAAKLYPLAVEMAGKIKNALNCDGINILQNNGEAAGQTVSHFHLHIIPRYENDGVSVGWSPKDPKPEEFERVMGLLS